MSLPLLPAARLACGPTRTLALVALVLGAARPALAQQCAVGAQVYTTALSTCAYGLPQVDGDFVLIPKVCRHELAGRAVWRRSVEVKQLATGQKVQQASLPPQDATATALPVVGQLWPGAPALLVYPQGIAAIDPKAGSAEPVHEPTGPLVAVARSGDLLALVEQLPAKGKDKGGFEWTVLDLGAGELLGQVHFGAGEVADLRWSRDGKKSAATATCKVADAKGATKWIELTVAVTDASGKSAVRDQALEPKVSPAKAPGSAEQPSGVPTVSADPSARPDMDALRVEANSPVRVARPLVPVTCTPHAPGATCLAIVGTAAPGRWLAWVQPASGARELRGCTAK